jgi:hypothetical protein
MDDNFAYIHDNNNATGFTNNWLESRRNVHLFDQHYSDFALYSEQNDGGENYHNITKSMVERNPVSDMFFSHNNMKHLKQLICDTVYQRSGGKYIVSPEAQSDNDLLTIMRYMYLEHGKHLPDQIKEQVNELNYQVMIDLVPRVISNAQLHLTYIRDRSQQPLAMDRPQYVSSAGTRSNNSVTTTFI